MNKCLLTDAELYALIGALEGCGVVFPEDMTNANYLRIYKLLDAFKYGLETYETNDEEDY
jgi:hypothetical protein